MFLYSELPDAARQTVGHFPHVRPQRCKEEKGEKEKEDILCTFIFFSSSLCVFAPLRENSHLACPDL
jgi:hypothetical protein